MKVLDLIRELSAYAVSEGNVEVMISSSGEFGAVMGLNGWGLHGGRM